MKLLPLLIGALLCANAFAQAPDASQPIAIEAFTRFDEFGEVKISPDGEYLALATGKYGRSAVVFIERKTQKVTSGVRTREGGEIDQFEWISPTRVLYSIAERWPGIVQPIRTGELYAIDRDGGRHKQLYGARAGESSTGTHLKKRESSFGSAELLSVLEDDPKHILIAEYAWHVGVYVMRSTPDAKPIVSRLDVYSGAKKKLDHVPLASAGLLVDRNEQVRFALGWNQESKLAVTWKPQAGGAWREFELSGFRDESVVPQRFSADNRSVYFTAVRTGESHARLFRLDLESHASVEVSAFDSTSVTEVITDFADREIVGMQGYADKPVRKWLLEDDAAAKLYKGLERAFAPQTVEITSTTKDGSLAVVFAHSDTNPGDYYLFDTVARKADLLRPSRRWIDPRRMRPMEPFELAARDGLTLHGYLTRPAGEAPHPLIVMPHGGPHTVRDLWEFNSEVQLLASRGYAVLQVNYRGSGGYGMDFEAAGYRQWGRQMQDDVTDATRWAIEQKVTSADRVCIYGASYGGYAALMGAVREPQLYRCAIGYAGVYDLELMFTATDFSDSRLGRSYLERVLGTDPAVLHANSPVYNAQRIEIPLLLIHGKEDVRADYQHAKRMKAALERSGKKFEWLALAGEGHGVYDENTRREVYERILAFLDTHLMKVTTAAR
jgi:dipeptidyl aminopeptidase/acylaminoacyl peptidase